MIAAAALEHGLSVVTLDKDFTRVPDDECRRWSETRCARAKGEREGGG